MALLAALAAAAIGVTPSAQSGNRPGRYARESDFYYYGNTRVSLTRSHNEVVVRFGANAPADAQRLRELSATRREEIRTAQRRFQILTIDQAQDDQAAAHGVSHVDRMYGLDGVEFAAPVYYHTETGTRVVPTDEIIIKVKSGTKREALDRIASAHGLVVDRAMWGTGDEFILRLDGTALDPVAVSRALYEASAFEWAEPNFITDYEKFGVPNDPLYGQQWHLQNTGQGGGTPGADVKATAAWDVEQGDGSVTIAIIDDGVEMTHEDLASRIFVNPREIPGNLRDDDANGYVDDVNGWNFHGNNNNPRAGDGDWHGTPLAGVAAAAGNNGIGGSGICRNCRILPIKVFNNGLGVHVSTVAQAIRYASTLADVLSDGFGAAGPPFAVIHSAIQFATTSGRGGRGAVVLAAAGNAASPSRAWTTRFTHAAGTYTLRWEFVKDASGSEGDDTAGLGWVQFPNGERVTFEGGVLPAGWTTGGDAPWSVVRDPVRADEGACYTHVAKSGPISHGQRTWIQVRRTLTPGDIRMFLWASSEMSRDSLRLIVDLNDDGVFDTSDMLNGVGSGPFSGYAGVAYPAAHPEAIAVGASSNFDCRSHYSRFGPQLAFLAPSDGGPRNLRITTTDLMGTRGREIGNYTHGSTVLGYEGTSSATALAAGVAALILSRNPNLTAAQVRDIMQRTADKIGPEPYVNGRNERYGYGRLNAHAALLATRSPHAPVISTQPQSRTIVAGQNVLLTVVATGAAPLSYQWYQGTSGDTAMAISGATGASYTTDALTSAASYWVRVSNGFGTADSETATIAAVPPAPTLTSPSGTSTTNTPAFAWQPATSATHYQLWVNDIGQAARINATYTAAQVGCEVATGTCTVAPLLSLAAGPATWWVRALNVSGPGQWSAGMNFVVPPPPVLGTPTLVSPVGTIGTASPAYVWLPVDEATFYQLWVNDAAEGAKINTTYAAADAGCGDGTGTCTITPAVPLASGAARWWVRAMNASGAGPWSVGVPFTVPDIRPPSITITLPTVVDSYTATTKSLALAGMTSDDVGVTQVTWSTDRGPTGTAFLGSGTAGWSIPAVPVAPGVTVITVIARDAADNTASDTLIVTYTPPPGAPTLVSPVGPTATSTPPYVWQALAEATHYQLWVNDAVQGARINTTYTAAQAGCGGSIGTCTVVPGVALAPGGATWWVRASNASGAGPWSAGMAFTAADTMVPTITITTPTAEDAYTARINPIALAGTVSDNGTVTEVIWTTDRGSSGTASGTTAWSIAALSLESGVTRITVTARDGANNTATDTLVVTRLDPPGAPTLISPVGEITTLWPTYVWQPAAGATHYQLWVNDAERAAKIDWTVTADQVRCADGVRLCIMTPSVGLARGSATWWVRASNSAGPGPWSASLAFATPRPPPAATLVAPTGAISTWTPTYSWNAVSNATSYEIWVNDSRGVRVLNTFYGAFSAGCGNGVGQCNATPTTAIPSGAATWWIRTWGLAGAGAWSAAMTFTTPGPPPAPTLISPSGPEATTNLPTFVWQAIPGVTTYQLWVHDEVQWPRINTTYTAAAVGCPEGTGHCSVVALISLTPFRGVWWVRASNPGGWGPWSAAMNFDIPVGNNGPPEP